MASPVPDITIFSADTAPLIKFFVTQDGTTPVDLTQCTAFFYIRRWGQSTNIFSDAQSQCDILPNPPTIINPVAGSGTAQSIKVSSSIGFGVGNTIIVSLQPNVEEFVTITAVTDSTHISGIFASNVSSGSQFVVQSPVYYPTLAQNISLSPSIQSVGISSSALFAAGNVLAIGIGGASTENVTITSIADSTHISGIFLFNHTAGDFVGFANLTQDLTFNALNGYCAYSIPSGGLQAATNYYGQLKVIFANGIVQHGPVLNIAVSPGL